MIIGNVIGAIHATIQHPFYAAKKLLVVEKFGPDKKPGGDYLVAVDTVGAGPGETVLILDEGNGARQILGDKQAPVRSLIVGIVDEIS
ncbi:MAG TPA: EutN/CcmL family microcompartment protein [Kiritimatiellia bacterium]|nr:EutN/CcmL family microcompartment protein [Kiritimatiellia bacterium]